MSGQKKRPAVSAAGLGTPLGTECKDSTTTIPAEAVKARRAALIAELWPKNHCSYDELADWAQAYVDQAIAKGGRGQ